LYGHNKPLKLINIGIAMGRFLLVKQEVAQLVKNFSALYETRRFITVFTRAYYWTLSYAR
jgi:hypothetical protein